MTLEKYLRPSPGCAFIVTGLFSLFPMIITYLLIFEKKGFLDYKLGVIIDIVLWIIAYLIFYFTFYFSYRKHKQNMKLLEKRGILKSAEDDFSHAEPFFKDCLRVGDKYLFMNGEGRLVFINCLSVMRIEKIVYSGARSDIVWEYYLTVNGNEISIYHSDVYEPTEWERLAKKLTSLNYELKVDRKIKTKHVFIEKANED